LALSEVGELDLATVLATRAIAARPDHGVAAHALAHIHFERGDDAGGRAFLDEWLAMHGQTAVNCGRLTWHRALAQLALCDPEAALDSYRAQATGSWSEAFSVEDAVSLLWRLQQRGVDVSREWVGLDLDPPAPSPFRGFQLAHIAYALAAQHDDDGLRRLGEAVAVAAVAAVEHPAEPLRYLPLLVDALRLAAGAPSRGQQRATHAVRRDRELGLAPAPAPHKSRSCSLSASVSSKVGRVPPPRSYSRKPRKSRRPARSPNERASRESFSKR
jgi:hypothetical protein